MKPHYLQIQKMSRAWIALIFAVVLLFVALSSTATASGPAPNPATAQLEINFMETMIDHHNLAAEMARICLQKATHSELLKLCQNVIDSQTQEIKELQSMLLNWYQITKQPTIRPEGRPMLDQLNAASPGAQFEQVFMPMLIQHHTIAIERAIPCRDGADHGDLKNLCANMITAQKKEIQQLQGWLQQWYGMSFTPTANTSSSANPSANANANQNQNQTAGANANQNPSANVNQNQNQTSGANANQNQNPSGNAPTTLPTTGGDMGPNWVAVALGIALFGLGLFLLLARQKASG